MVFLRFSWIACWLLGCSAVGLARLARLAGRSVWLLGFVARRLGAMGSDTLDAQERSADLLEWRTEATFSNTLDAQERSADFQVSST